MKTDTFATWSSKYTVTIVRSKNELVVRKSNRVVRRMKVALGSSFAPTPRVSTYITGIHKIASQDDNGPIGPFVMHLAAWSPVQLDYYVDGDSDGISIQGTNQPALIGQNVSHGNIRVTNANLRWLVTTLEPGTPVEIV